MINWIPLTQLKRGDLFCTSQSSILLGNAYYFLHHEGDIVLAQHINHIVDDGHDNVARFISNSSVIKVKIDKLVPIS